MVICDDCGEDLTPAAVPESAIEPEPKRECADCGGEADNFDTATQRWLCLPCAIGCEIPAASSAIEVAPQVYACEPHVNLDDFRNSIVEALRLIAARLERKD